MRASARHLSASCSVARGVGEFINHANLLQRMCLEELSVRVAEVQALSPEPLEFPMRDKHRNRLTSVQQRSTDGGTLTLSSNYQYDVFNRRIEEDRWTSTTGTVVTRYGLDGNEVAVDLDGSSSLTMRYLRPDGMDQSGARISATGTVAWYLTDRLGSTRAMTDNSGVVVVRSLPTGDIVARLRGTNFTEVAWSADAATLVAGGFDSLVYVWRWPLDQPARTLRYPR